MASQAHEPYGFDDLDDESAALILRLHQYDVEGLSTRATTEKANDRLSDAVLALRVYREELSNEQQLSSALAALKSDDDDVIHLREQQDSVQALNTEDTGSVAVLSLASATSEMSQESEMPDRYTHEHR